MLSSTLSTTCLALNPMIILWWNRHQIKLPQQLPLFLLRPQPRIRRPTLRRRRDPAPLHQFPKPVKLLTKSVLAPPTQTWNQRLLALLCPPKFLPILAPQSKTTKAGLLALKRHWQVLPNLWSNAYLIMTFVSDLGKCAPLLWPSKKNGISSLQPEDVGSST